MTHANGAVTCDVCAEAMAADPFAGKCSSGHRIHGRSDARVERLEARIKRLRDALQAGADYLDDSGDCMVCDRTIEVCDDDPGCVGQVMRDALATDDAQKET